MFALLTLSSLPAWAASNADPGEKPNELTAAEKAAGWKLLFDGRTTEGWRGFHQEKFPASGWTVKDNCLMHVAGKGAQSQQGGDIITVDQYENFELQLEWRLAPGGNSGIKYFINESLPPTGLSGVGFEMQVLDDEGHPDAKMGRGGNRTAGALYDLIAPNSGKRAKPAGEFNQARLVVAGSRVEHWLNGVKVVEYQLGSENLRRLIAESKYKDIADFGKSHKGHILLQDHGDEVCYRNIKIRELTADGQPVKR
ncbi:MAG TPA: DUF1080 domain-containing protein [Pyrinomonadaceae bacterium]|nr:DUF1080 domain-containing protein [Pyrinomonadaceae bacterium]